MPGQTPIVVDTAVLDALQTPEVDVRHRERTVINSMIDANQQRLVCSEVGGLIRLGRVGGRPRFVAAAIVTVAGLGWFAMGLVSLRDAAAPSSSAVPWFLGGIVHILTAIGVTAGARWARLVGVVIAAGSLVIDIALGLYASSWGGVPN